MSLRFFSDHCVPTEIVAILRRRGHSVTLLRETLPVGAPDTAVIAKARELGLILLSLNGDFADIVTYPPARFLGIAALQLRNHPEVIPRLMDCLADFLDKHPVQEFYHGKLFLVEVHRVRIRQ